MAEQDPKQLADALDDDADKLERHSNEVQRRIDEARQDWERKLSDDSVPGARGADGGGDAPDAPKDD